MVIDIVGLAIVAAALLIPGSRKLVLQLIGLIAIASAGVAAIALPVWALYEAKSWFGAPETALTGSGSFAADSVAGQTGGAGIGATTAADGASKQHRLAQERQRRAEAQRQREEEERRLQALVEAVRSVVERERQYALVAASTRRLTGVDEILVDLITIRIPSWRDPALAEREQGEIRAWLHSIGLTPEETASISTANGWGSVYDLWREEHDTAAEAPLTAGREAVASVPDPPSPEEPPPDPVPEPQPATPSTYVDRRPSEPWTAPRRERSVQRSTVPPRTRAPERTVGPFGY
jgi:hypothetical protein